MTLKTKLLLRFGWCRIWSDKWIEQGARSPYPQVSANTVVASNTTLLKPYSTTSYSCVITIITDGDNSWNIKVIQINFFTTYFVAMWASIGFTINSTNGRFNYVAQGY